MTLSWVTVVWSMIASACLTLATMYFFVWFRNRSERAHLLFAVSAVSMMAFAGCELWMMRAATPDELMIALQWAHVPLGTWLASTTWFVCLYLEAGRRWLAWTILWIRMLLLIPNFQPGQNLSFRAGLPLDQVRFFGEPVSIPAGIPSPWVFVAQTSVLLILLFVADASVTAWRRGERRKALIVGGSVELLLLISIVSGAAIVWGVFRMPFIFSMPYMCLVMVMAYELGRDVLRASQLVIELRATEAGLRENQVKLQASNQQISDLFGRLIAAQETERTRIARDLHDDVGQRIAGISIAMSGLKRKLTGGPADGAMAALTSMQRDTAALADEVRQVSHELHPTLLQHAGLIEALRGVCTQFERLHGVAVAYQADANLDALPHDAALTLYRVAQEALYNVSKHAVASHIHVALTQIPDGVELSIADDGKGFNLADGRVRSSGLGLLSIDERVRLLRGRVEIQTTPGGGTRLQVQIPVELIE